jgi:hypothetical protein
MHVQKGTLIFNLFLENDDCRVGNGCQTLKKICSSDNSDRV